jgi:Protein of unknown function (DUF2510)
MDAASTGEDQLARLRELAGALIDSDSPYDIGREIHFGAMGAISDDGEVDGRARLVNDSVQALWLVWGSLTDWVENKPHETAQAETEMRRAAREWLALPDDEPNVRAYFDRWVYDEMEYARRGQPQETPGAPAGWYSDPDHPQGRYWDGSRWSSRQRGSL